MSSMTAACILEDPNRHLIVRNFSAAQPKLTYTGVTLTETP
jgi:hypothetical protein